MDWKRHCHFDHYYEQKGMRRQMKVLITAAFSDTAIEELKSIPLEIIYRPWRKTRHVLSERELIEVLNVENVDILVTELENVDEDVIRETNLKLIAYCRGNPLRHVDIDTATRKKIPVLHTPGRNANAVAEMTIALMLAMLRKIVYADRLYREKNIKIESTEAFTEMYEQLCGLELNGKTVGIIGLGRIGYRVAKLLNAFGVHVVVYDPYIGDKRIAEVNAEKVDLDTLLRNSDIITIHASVTENSIELIGQKEIEKMKPTAFLFNLASPLIIDEDALFNALKTKRIAGAGIDVSKDEPVESSHRFFSLDNVVLTPHIGGNTYEVIEIQSNMIVADIKRFLNGQRPIHVLNPEIFLE